MKLKDATLKQNKLLQYKLEESQVLVTWFFLKNFDEKWKLKKETLLFEY